jgi:hypothetical protein
MGWAEAAFATVQALNMAIEARLVEINERIPPADGSTRREHLTADESGLFQALSAGERLLPLWCSTWSGRKQHPFAVRRPACPRTHFSSSA